MADLEVLLSLRIPVWLMEKLRELAEADNRTVSNLVRGVVQEWVRKQ